MIKQIAYIGEMRLCDTSDKNAYANFQSLENFG